MQEEAGSVEEPLEQTSDTTEPTPTEEQQKPAHKKSSKKKKDSVPTVDEVVAKETETEAAVTSDEVEETSLRIIDGYPVAGSGHTSTQLIWKPLEGSSGQGIKKYTPDDWKDGPEAFLAKMNADGKGILEEMVIQHPKMASLCPTSVNTCRIATLLGDKQQGIVYAFLRIGNGKVMDNVDCGGMAARIDLDTGRLLTVGADKQGNTFIKHPITNTSIIGFTIPYWEEAKAMCLKAAEKVPEMRFIAWDVAITENGPTFIEGNSFPSHAVPQFAAHYPDGIGILPEFRKFIDI